MQRLGDKHRRTFKEDEGALELKEKHMRDRRKTRVQQNARLSCRGNPRAHEVHEIGQPSAHSRQQCWGTLGRRPRQLRRCGMELHGRQQSDLRRATISIALLTLMQKDFMAASKRSCVHQLER